MKKADAIKRLAALGFEIDWSVTGPGEGCWSGTIDAIGRGCIDGDCLKILAAASRMRDV